jgi:hypothetical protein
MDVDHSVNMKLNAGFSSFLKSYMHFLPSYYISLLEIFDKFKSYFCLSHDIKMPVTKMAHRNPSTKRTGSIFCKKIFQTNFNMRVLTGLSLLLST